MEGNGKTTTWTSTYTMPTGTAWESGLDAPLTDTSLWNYWATETGDDYYVPTTTGGSSLPKQTG